MLTGTTRVVLMAAVLATVTSDLAAAESSVAAPRRLLAAWQNIEPDGMGSTYYFYPDGVLVIQNPRRREFVILARWRMESPQVFVIFDQRPLHTTLSRVELADWRRGHYRWRITSLGRREMRLVSMNAPGVSDVFRHRGPLPNRTENIYWGLGTEASYARGMRKELGQ
jgi:hypothetical protein